MITEQHDCGASARLVLVKIVKLYIRIPPILNRITKPYKQETGPQYMNRYV